MANVPSTTYPRIMQVIDSHLKRVKPSFDEVSVGVINLTVQPSRERAVR